MATLRKARLSDIRAIHAIVKRFADREMMLPLSLGDVTERLRDFWVAEEDGAVVGTVALHVTWDRLMEIRSLAVAPECHGRRLGRRLVDKAHEEARAMDAAEVFVLTYIPEFFEKLGYDRVARESLPHKVWQDCVKCPKFPDCGEIALKTTLA